LNATKATVRDEILLEMLSIWSKVSSLSVNRVCQPPSKMRILKAINGQNKETYHSNKRGVQ